MRARRLLAVLALSLVSFAASGIVAAPPAAAHPLGNFTVNRYSGIQLSPGQVRVLYVLDMAEVPTFQEMERLDTDGNDEVSEYERAVWADREIAELGSGLRLVVDGSSVSLAPGRRILTLAAGQAGLQVLRLEAVFTGPLPRDGTASYRDSNGRGQLGWREVTVSSRPGVSLSRSSVPVSSLSRALSSYPQDMLSSPLDVTQASFSFRPGKASGTTTGSEQAAPSPRGRDLLSSLVTRADVGLPIAALTLLLAFGLGALHALGPGHGKTIMAAYLVGGGNALRHALTVGVAISLMHTASVLGLGLVTMYATRLFPPERVYPWLGALSGVVALGLGARLLVVRWRANRRRDGLAHGHGPGEGSEQHAHGHGEGSKQHLHSGHQPEALDRSHPVPARPLSRTGLVALAMSGGILPSPTAFLVLVAAIALHRVGYGLALVAAFSLGLASALTAVGVVAVRAGSFVSRRFGHRAGRSLSIGSAAALFVAGLFVATRAIVQIG